jgi:hypothetical protein
MVQATQLPFPSSHAIFIAHEEDEDDDDDEGEE